MIRNLDGKRLEAVLQAFFQPVLGRAWPRWSAWLRRSIGRRER
jgi:hypothetical protein